MLTHVKYGMGAARNELSELSWRSGRSRRWEKPGGFAMKLSFGIEHRSPLIIANLRSAKKKSKLVSRYSDIAKDSRIKLSIRLTCLSGVSTYVPYDFRMDFPMKSSIFFVVPQEMSRRSAPGTAPHSSHGVWPPGSLGSQGLAAGVPGASNLQAMGMTNAGWWLSHLPLWIIYC